MDLLLNVLPLDNDQQMYNGVYNSLILRLIPIIN